MSKINKLNEKFESKIDSDNLEDLNPEAVKTCIESMLVGVDEVNKVLKKRMSHDMSREYIRIIKSMESPLKELEKLSKQLNDEMERYNNE